MDRIAEICLALLRFVFTGEALPEEYKCLSDEDGKYLYAMAKRHDIAHIVAFAADKAGVKLPDEVKCAFRKLRMAAFYRSGILEEEQRKIEELLEKQQIKFIPLKGAVIKKFYPEEWMRIGSDIDILVHEEDLPLIEKLFTEELSYKIGITGNHDMGFETPSGAHIEMHYRLISKEDVTSAVLEDVWSYTVLKENMKYQYEISGEMFMFYHLAHMSKHFKHGGCGIRFFIDLWLIEKNIEYDKGKLYEILERGSLIKFYEKSKNIIDYWMFGKGADELTKEASEYVLVGGIYGNTEHHVALKHRKKMRKVNYLLKRIFVKGKSLAYFYPKINKYPILIPYYEVKRWLGFLNKEKFDRVKREVSVNMKVKREDVEKAKMLMEKLGI